MRGLPDIVLFDLDMTLVNTSALESLRNSLKWSRAYGSFDQTAPFPGVVETIRELTGRVQMGVVTNTPRPYAERLVRFHNIEIPILVAYHDTGNHKPAPQPFLKACSLLNVNPSSQTIVSVGDDKVDMQATKAIEGMYSIAVTYGVSSPSELYSSGADVLIKDFYELIDAFIELGL
jgi:HAD superfamily hydrolase (TIGR01549 family)